MNSIPDLTKDLRQHHAICQQLLAIAEREGVALRGVGGRDRANAESSPGLGSSVSAPANGARDFYETRQSLYPQLEASVERLKLHRAAWQQLSPSQRALHPEVSSLLRLTQDLIMKVLVLERENEQMLLRNGLIPPAHLPSVNRQRPHFVADLYRRGASS